MAQKEGNSILVRVAKLLRLSMGIGLGRMKKMAASPYMVKSLETVSSPELENQCPWDLVCRIWGVNSTEFVRKIVID